MEYLTTYGFAILAIAIVLAVLYTFGVFSRFTFVSSSCIAEAGYVCTNPMMNTSGYLSFGFGQVGQYIMLTGFSCTSSTAAPTSWQTPTNVTVNLQSDYKVGEVVRCSSVPLPIGSQYAGYLWVQYTNLNTGQTGLEANFGSVTGTVSATQTFGVTPSASSGSFQYIATNGTDLSAMLASGSSVYICAASDGGYPLMMQSWGVPDVADAGAYTSIGRQSGNTCMVTQSQTGMLPYMTEAIMGVSGSSTPNVFTLSTGSSPSTSLTVPYTVAAANSFVVIVAECGDSSACASMSVDPVDGRAVSSAAELIAPSATSTCTYQTQNVGADMMEMSFIATCQGLAPGMYSITASTGSDAAISAAAYVFPGFNPVTPKSSLAFYQTDLENSTSAPPPGLSAPMSGAAKKAAAVIRVAGDASVPNLPNPMNNNLYICFGAAGEGSIGGSQSWLQQVADDQSVTSIGLQTNSECQLTTAYTSPVVGNYSAAMVGLEDEPAPVITTINTSSSTSSLTLSYTVGTGLALVSGDPDFVVLAISCAQVNGGCGTITPSDPNCVSQQSETGSDNNESVAIFTCQTAPGDYSVSVTTRAAAEEESVTQTAGPAITITAYVFNNYDPSEYTAGEQASMSYVAGAPMYETNASTGPWGQTLSVPVDAGVFDAYICVGASGNSSIQAALMPPPSPSSLASGQGLSNESEDSNKGGPYTLTGDSGSNVVDNVCAISAYSPPPVGALDPPGDPVASGPMPIAKKAAPSVTVGVVGLQSPPSLEPLYTANYSTLTWFENQENAMGLGGSLLGAPSMATLSVNYTVGGPLAAKKAPASISAISTDFVVIVAACGGYSGCSSASLAVPVDPAMAGMAPRAVACSPIMENYGPSGNESVFAEICPAQTSGTYTVSLSAAMPQTSKSSFAFMGTPGMSISVYDFPMYLATQYIRVEG